MRCISILVILILSAPVFAQRPVWSNAVCGVCNPAGGCGTGTVIHQDGKQWAYVVTNQHVVGSHSTAAIEWSNGYTQSGKVIYRHRAADLAVVALRVRAKLVVLPIANSDQMPEPDSVVQLAGYGTKRKFTVWSATYKGTEELRGGTHQVKVDTEAESGDSGGPIIYKNRLIGVLWGGSGYVKRGGFQIMETRGCIGSFLFKAFPAFDCAGPL